jgi:ATP-dependent Lhr-like helicase
MTEMEGRAFDKALVRGLDKRCQSLFVTFQVLTPVQRQGIPLLLGGTDCLFVAPTASGKTEAVVAPLLHRLFTERWAGSSPRILYVAPTRALVNDITQRLQKCLQGTGLSVGARTGEHHQTDVDIVVTTPESFDSMLARGSQDNGHLLQKVRAVILDELHLIWGTPRGVQLACLLGRLDRIVTGGRPQRAALSATVSDPDALSLAFLSQPACIVSAGGGRTLAVERFAGSGPLPERGTGLDPLATELFVSGIQGSTGDVDNVVASLFERGLTKGLVFVNSRARCDLLTADLMNRLGRTNVFAHHGSLDRSQRERAEENLRNAQAAVVVATSTLEVGIDVGNVDYVLLDGPPPDVASLLQRVGRANRRGGNIRVVPVAANKAQACILASQIRCATEGLLDPRQQVSHLSVAVQQAASLSLSARRGLVSRAEYEAVIQSIRGVLSSNAILTALISAGKVSESRAGWLSIHAEEWLSIVNSMGVHGNIGEGRKRPVIDSVTGETLAWVDAGRQSARMTIAGQDYEVDRRDDGFYVRGSDQGTAAPAKYPTARAPIGRATLEHLRRGIGLPTGAIVLHSGRWFHFGGAIFSALLRAGGIPSNPLNAGADPRGVDREAARHFLESNWPLFEGLFGFGPHHALLPETLRRMAVMESLPFEVFGNWIDGLSPVTVRDSQQLQVLDSATG